MKSLKVLNLYENMYFKVYVEFVLYIICMI